MFALGGILIPGGRFALGGICDEVRPAIGGPVSFFPLRSFGSNLK